VNLVKLFALAIVIALCFAPVVMAQGGAPPATSAVNNVPGTWSNSTSAGFAGAVGAGLVVIGGGYGIGRLAAAALESMARQPEVAGNIQTAMIIAAALIEGFTFFALYICMTQNPWVAAG
jgi:F-type H+-transporting ATPase subunit c